jgi:tricorn protease-like protein
MGKFNPNDNSLDAISLDHDFPLGLASYQDSIIVSHYDQAKPDVGGITIYDTKTDKKDYFELDHGAEQIAMDGTKLYVLSDNEIHRYEIGNQELKKEGSTKIELSKDSYLSGIFTRESNQD